MFRRDITGVFLLDGVRFLAQWRGPNMQRHPNEWGLFGGGIEEGETALEAMQREMKEELDYVAPDLEPLIEYDYSTPTRFGRTYLFVARFSGFEHLRCLEGDGWKLMPIDEAIAIWKIEFDHAALLELKKYLANLTIRAP